MRMARDAADAQDQPAVLDVAVGIEKLGADRPPPRAARRARASAPANLSFCASRVVVQKHQHVAAGLRRGKVVQAGRS